MGRKKRPFIDKKNSVTFRLVNRSQQDPLAADERAPQHVLLPINKNQPSTSSSTPDFIPPEKRKKEQTKFGIFFDDDYDYLQHLKEPGRHENHWEEVPNKKTENKPKIQLPSSVFASEFEEKEGLLNKAAPKGLALDWDPDVVAAMDEDFDFDDPDNELEDDFMALAMGGTGDDEEIELCPDDDENWEDEEESDFDSDAADYSGEEDDELGDLPLHKFDDEETKSRFTEYSMSSSVMRRNNQLTLLDDRFEKFYENYDDPEVGDLECDEIEGHIALEEEMIDQFSDEMKKKHLPLPYDKAWDVCRLTKMRDYENEKEEIVNLEVDDYERNEKGEKKKWDCESYLSNYSNIYNHPKMIDVPSKRASKITINPKTGLPSDAFDQSGKLTEKSLAKLQDGESKKAGPKSLCAESVISTLSVLSIRPKDETNEEKHERKKLLKEFRKERRIEKKLNREAFNQERLRQKAVEMNRKNQQGGKIV